MQVRAVSEGPIVRPDGSRECRHCGHTLMLHPAWWEDLIVEGWLCISPENEPETGCLRGWFISKQPVEFISGTFELSKEWAPDG